jgi:Leucine-rich repeat (LRR) protein
MRWSQTLFLFALTVPTIAAGEVAPETSKLEKAGARVKVDDSLPQEARLRVSFMQLDDKAVVALKDAKNVGSLTVENASRLGDKSLAVIGTLTNLRELTLIKANITNSGLAHLKNLKELRKLVLMDAKVGDSGVSGLKELTNLEELDLTGTGISSSAATTFKSLTNLTTLAVGRTKFGDAGAAQLKDLSSLKSLEADISVKAAMALEAEIPGIRIRR